MFFDDTHFRSHSDFTPREFRALALSALVPIPGGLLWDIGAGSGAVALEWVAARKGNRAVAVECEAKHVALIRENVNLLRSVDRDPGDVQVMHGSAAEVLKCCADAPDAFFLGCPTQTSEAVVEELHGRLRIGGRFVCNAIQASSVIRVMTTLCKHPDEGHVWHINLFKQTATGHGTSEKPRLQLVLTKA